MKKRFGKHYLTLSIPVIFFLFLNVGSEVCAQVSISPTTIFVEKPNNFGSFSIQNTSNRIQEVSVRFKFGYVATDSVGNIYMNYSDSTRARRYSMTSWVHAFPRSITLNPSQTQTVRIMARPPHNLTDGMYWTRMYVTSNPQSSLVGSSNKSNVSANINFKFVQVTSVFYNNGNTKTGISFDKLYLQRTSRHLNFLSDVKQTGNAPFLGTVRLKIYNQNGKMVAKNTLMTTIYFNETIKLDINKSELSSGDYKATVTFSSGRNDIDRKNIINAKTVSKTIKFRIP